eukprot:bmy_22665T0
MEKRRFKLKESSRSCEVLKKQCMSGQTPWALGRGPGQGTLWRSRPNGGAHGRLLLFSSAVSSQPVVTQELSLTVLPGLTVTLTGSMSTGSSTTGNAQEWFLKKPGQTHLQLIHHMDKCPASIPSCFSGSILGGKAVLTIAGVQPKEETEDFCIVWSDAPVS